MRNWTRMIVTMLALVGCGGDGGGGEESEAESEAEAEAESEAEAEAEAESEAEAEAEAESEAESEGETDCDAFCRYEQLCSASSEDPEPVCECREPDADERAECIADCACFTENVFAPAFVDAVVRCGASDDCAAARACLEAYQCPTGAAAFVTRCHEVVAGCDSLFDFCDLACALNDAALADWQACYELDCAEIADCLSAADPCPGL